MLKSIFLRFGALILTFLMLLVVGLGTGEEYDVKDPDKCALHFAVFSDVHVEGNNLTRYEVFTKAMQDVKRHKSGHDAVVFLGDSTMNGQVIENLFFHGAVNWFLADENVLPVIGNHDVGNGEGDYVKLQNRWYDFTAAFFGRKLTTPYYCEVVDGCYFIFLAQEAQRVHEMPMSDAQFAFLAQALDKAAESGKPAFVFEHFPTDYATDLDLAPTDRLTDMLAEYSRGHDLFVFVGHTHMPMHMSWSFHTYDGYPETYLPCLTRLGGGDDSGILDDTGVGLEVEVYENEVVLRARDFYRSAWYVDDDENGTLCEKTYELKGFRE
jgi:hypothetical protein